jgi:hypothetical protein
MPLSIFSCFLHIQPAVFQAPDKAVILRACDFFACAQKWLLSMERAVVDGKGVPPPSNCPIPSQLSFSSPFCHPERTRVSYITALNSATYVVLPKENHMQLTEVATLDRKSGEAEGSAVRHSGAPYLQFYNSKLPRKSRPPDRTDLSRLAVEAEWRGPTVFSPDSDSFISNVSLRHSTSAASSGETLP